jgi:hypothetical protein
MCRFEEAAKAKSIKRVGGARQGGRVVEHL